MLAMLLMQSEQPLCSLGTGTCVNAICRQAPYLGHDWDALLRKAMEHNVMCHSRRERLAMCMTAGDMRMP